MQRTPKSTVPWRGGAQCATGQLQVGRVAGQLAHLAVPGHRDDSGNRRTALLNHGVLALVDRELHPLRELVADRLDAHEGQLHNHAGSVQGPVRPNVLLGRHHDHVGSIPVAFAGSLAGVFSVRFICGLEQQQTTSDLVHSHRWSCCLMTVTDARDSPPDWQTRVLLALALLQQRTPNDLTCELAVMALRGATVAQLHDYERAA